MPWSELFTDGRNSKKYLPSVSLMIIKKTYLITLVYHLIFLAFDFEWIDFTTTENFTHAFLLKWWVIDSLTDFQLSLQSIMDYPFIFTKRIILGLVESKIAIGKMTKRDDRFMIDDLNWPWMTFRLVVMISSFPGTFDISTLH